MIIHVLQHEVHEHPGHIADWAKARGHKLEIINPRTGIGTKPNKVTLLILLGGALNVDETAAHPWLVPEKAFVRAVAAADTPILGICLGSQLLAEALGAAVRKNPVPEIGWHELSVPAGDPSALPWPEHVLEWHGQTFDIPKGAALLASSQYCTNQAFSRGGYQIGLQFHPEWTHDIASHVAKNEPYEANGGSMQALDEVMSGDFTASRPFLFALLGHLALKAGAPV